jgi:Flp pilus assembly protein TadD
LTPDSAEGHLNLGIALADHLDLDGALSEFSEAVRLKPDSPSAHYNKGRALLDLRRNEEAETELQTAVRLDSRNASALYLLAVAEKQLDKTGHSAELLQEVLAIEPRNTDAHYLLGQNFAKLGKESDAIAQWQNALQLDPDHAEALYNLARHLSQTDPERAKHYQGLFVDLQRKRRITERAETLGNFALAAATARDWNQAVSQLEEAVQVCGNCQSRGDLHKDLGLIYCRSGNLDKGERELRVAQSLKPEDPDVKKSLDLIAELKSGKLRR